MRSVPLTLMDSRSYSVVEMASPALTELCRNSARRFGPASAGDRDADPVHHRFSWLDPLEAEGTLEGRRGPRPR